MEKTKKLNKSILKAIKQVTKMEVEKNAFGWPPICAGIYYQPKRPKNRKIL